LRTFKNEALDIDIMHRKLKCTDKQFNLEELSATYNVSKKENSSSEDAYKIALLLKPKIKAGS
jgi:hypothetical protein